MKKISVFKIFIKLFPMVFSLYPIYFTTALLLGILNGTFLGITTLATNNFFNVVESGIKGDATYSWMVITALLLGFSIFGCIIVGNLHNFMMDSVGKKMIGQFSRKLHSKFSRVDPINFENSEFLDSINKAKTGIDGSLALIGTIASIFTFYLPYFLFMGSFLFRIDPVLLISLVFIFIPVVLTHLIRLKVYNKLEDEIAPIRRKCDHYEESITSRAYYKETRILGAYNHFKELYADTLNLLIRKTWKAEKRTGLIELGIKLITLAGYFCVLFLLCRSLFLGRITAGTFSAVLSSLGTLFHFMEEIIYRRIGHMTQNLGAITNFLDFFDIPERSGKDITLNTSEGIRLENVTFRYPQTNRDVINGINLKIDPNETIAIIGENGSGKTTLVRLLTGLYLPDKGSVKWGETGTDRVSPQSIYKGISGVFQKYQRYKMTLADNISISSNNPQSDLERAVVEADINPLSKSFPKGFDTMLSREFNGVDLSGGQWQRVAIARGFYRAHDLIILDEPTAAIDPIEETKIYKKFAQISKDKTAFIVTHRLGSAKIADRIIVMDEGQIVETGTHDELIDRDGKYASMYESQAKWYERETVESLN